MEEFAKRMKVALNTVSRWENSQPPTGKTLKRLYALANRVGAVHSIRPFELALREGNAEAFQKVRSAQIVTPENLERMRSAFRELYLLERRENENFDNNDEKWFKFVKLAEMLYVGGYEEFSKTFGEDD
jgi:transcriptional regulator with XRE-family HTH domain